jgi:hypothetical protein
MAEYTGASYISPPIKKDLNGKFNNPATSVLNMSNNAIINCQGLTLTQLGGGGITFADGSYQVSAGGGGGSATPGGPPNSLQYNNGGGGITGSANLKYDETTLGLTGTFQLNGTLRPTAINYNSSTIAISGNNTITNQGEGAVAIGTSAGTTSQLGNAVAIGTNAGRSNQQANAVAIGTNAGFTGQLGNSVAIGYNAGRTNQLGNAVAIGTNAGFTGQGSNAVAIGTNAGYTGQQASAVAIGNSAGNFDQSGNAVAIGNSAGFTRQGSNAVAIGYQAGQTNQARNSIVINALDSALNTDISGTLFIKPVRNDATVDVTLNALIYKTTGEITYGNKTFVIPHPLDKEKYLVHACLEGPEAGVYYRGTSFILPEADFTEITLPNYVDTLANNFTVHVTPVTDQASDVILSASRFIGGKFKVYQKKTILKKVWQRLKKNTAEPQYFDYIVFGKRASLETEPLKELVEVKGQGPYTWL